MFDGTKRVVRGCRANALHHSKLSLHYSLFFSVFGLFHKRLVSCFHCCPLPCLSTYRWAKLDRHRGLLYVQSFLGCPLWSWRLDYFHRLAHAAGTQYLHIQTHSARRRVRNKLSPTPRPQNNGENWSWKAPVLSCGSTPCFFVLPGSCSSRSGSEQEDVRKSNCEVEEKRRDRRLPPDKFVITLGKRFL